MSFFLVLDTQIVWGAGRTVTEAIEEASRWVESPETGAQGGTFEQVQAMLITHQQSKDGLNGFFLYEVKEEWPENAPELDGDAWLKFFFRQEEK